MNYTLHQLQVFVQVAQSKSITRAAQQLHLTQPAVSIQLRNLQAQFDIPLTEVVGRQIYITDFGAEIALAAEQILGQVDLINQRSLSHKGQVTGRLKLAIVSTGKYVMPYFLPSFLRLHPAVELIMDVTNKSKVIESLEQNQVDFALVSVLPELLSIHHLMLMPNNLYLIANTEKKYSKRSADLSILSSLPFINREVGSGTRYVTEQFLKASHISIKSTIELTSNEAVKQAVIAGLGVSIMPLIGIKNELINGDLQIVPIKKLPLTSSWQIIWMKGKSHLPAPAAFLDHLRAKKDDIIHSQFQWYNAY